MGARLGDQRFVRIAQRLGQREHGRDEEQPADAEEGLVGRVHVHAPQAPGREPHCEREAAPDHRTPHRRVGLAQLVVTHVLGERERGREAKHVAHHHEGAVEVGARQVSQARATEQHGQAERDPDLELPGPGVFANRGGLHGAVFHGFVEHGCIFRCASDGINHPKEGCIGLLLWYLLKVLFEELYR